MASALLLIDIQNDYFPGGKGWSLKKGSVGERGAREILTFF